MNATPQLINRILKTGILAFTLAVSIARPAESHRTFTDQADRTFDGTLEAFNATNQMVTIQRSDGKTGSMPLAVFSEEDRNYISHWGITNDFMTGVKLAFQLESTEPPEQEALVSRGNKDIRDFHYLVQLKNRSTSMFEKIDVEYCIFYRQGERDGFTIHYDEGTCHGKTRVESLRPGSSELIETRSVRLYSQSGLQTIFGTADDLSTAEIRGIWLRLKMKLPSGAVLEREYRTVDDEICKWTPYSIGAGMNQGSAPVSYFVK